MIEINNVSKNYGNKQVLKNISFTIKENCITSFIGSNGAGKSTLLSLITRLDDLESGEVIIDGINLKAYDNNTLSKKISVLKQQNFINMNLTIKELVSFGRFPYAKKTTNLSSEDEKYVDEAITYMKLEDIKDQSINSLSGGQLQRAYIAMIMAQNTKYIFLDEPLNNLDMKHATETMRLLKNMCKKFNKTIIIVIHDINYVSFYSDQIIALKDGEIIFDDITKNVIESNNLNKIYDLDFDVMPCRNQHLCIYF